MSVKSEKKEKCFWCGGQVGITLKGHIRSHVTAGGLKCIGTGMRNPSPEMHAVRETNVTGRIQGA